MSLLSEETLRKLRELNLGEMIDAIDTQSQDISYSTLSFEDRIKMAIDYVYQKKYNGKVQRLIKLSKFRISNANVNDICYIDRGLDRQGIRTRYIRVADLLMLRDEAALSTQGISKLLKKLTNYQVIVFDEWLFDDLSAEDQHFLFD